MSAPGALGQTADETSDAPQEQAQNEHWNVGAGLQIVVDSGQTYTGLRTIDFSPHLSFSAERLLGNQRWLGADVLLNTSQSNSDASTLDFQADSTIASLEKDSDLNIAASIYLRRFLNPGSSVLVSSFAGPFGSIYQYYSSGTYEQIAGDDEGGGSSGLSSVRTTGRSAEFGLHAGCMLDYYFNQNVGVRLALTVASLGVRHGSYQREDLDSEGDVLQLAQSETRDINLSFLSLPTLQLRMKF